MEWGFLYSPKRQGQPGRYPSFRWLADALQSLPKNVRVAMHVCGDGVHHLLGGQTNETHLLDLVVARKGRIQLNFNQVRKPIDLGKLANLLMLYHETTFITQDNNTNQGVWKFVAERGVRNHAVLFDGSGGQGIPCSEWPQSLPIPCGYAGGLGPDNIRGELDRIAAVAGNRPTWIDMEGKLRQTDVDGADWLNLDACRACLEAVQAHTLNMLNHEKDKRQNPAPVVNSTLAGMLAGEPNPMEDLVVDQSSAKGVWTIGLAQTDLLKHGRVVQLACGHYTLSKSMHKARCPRCGEMIRAGYDYDAFRRMGARDDFSWPDDPFRAVHESNCEPRRHSPV